MLFRSEFKENYQNKKSELETMKADLEKREMDLAELRAEVHAERDAAAKDKKQ